MRAEYLGGRFYASLFFNLHVCCSTPVARLGFGDVPSQVPGRLGLTSWSLALVVCWRRGNLDLVPWQPSYLPRKHCPAGCGRWVGRRPPGALSVGVLGGGCLGGAWSCELRPRPLELISSLFFNLHNCGKIAADQLETP
jgi:hypothetical protein